MEPGCYGKSNTDNLPAPTDMPTDLDENPILEKKAASQKSMQKSALYGLCKLYEIEPVLNLVLI